MGVANVYSFLYINISSAYHYLVPYTSCIFIMKQKNEICIVSVLREINDFDFDLIFEVWRLPLVAGVERPAENYEAVAGTGEHCVPGAADSCGDGGPALQARLIFPKVRHFWLFLCVTFIIELKSTIR
jgi:hypothetical protein